MTFLYKTVDRTGKVQWMTTKPFLETTGDLKLLGIMKLPFDSANPLFQTANQQSQWLNPLVGHMSSRESNFRRNYGR